MKKLLSLTLVSVILGAGIVRADTFVANTAKNQRGEEVDSNYGGYDATRITAAGAAGEEVVCSGRCVLSGLIPSTGGTGNLIYIYDTSVAAQAGTLNNRLKMTSNFWTVETGSAIGRVPRPVRFTNGISVRLASIAAGESVTVLFVDLDQR